MTICDNARSRPGGLGVPGCFKNEATQTIEVVYYDHGAWGQTDVRIRDSDVVSVCDECAPRVIRDAERHGYEVVRRAAA
jgi:hypothetical protein